MTKVIAASNPIDTPGEQIPLETLKAALELWSQAGEAHYVPLHGTSMLPLLRDGDQVLVSHNLSMVRNGDIVVFQLSNGLVAHRVLASLNSTEGRVFRTKGDNLLAYDPLIPQEQLFGRVLTVRRADRQMSIDTPAWQISGWLVAGVMRAQAWLYDRANQDGNQHPAWVLLNLNRGVHWLGRKLIYLCQFLLGRWQDEAAIREDTL